MKRYSIIIYFLHSLCSPIVLAQTNTTLLSNFTYNTEVIDVWGYAAGGREYALTGLTNGLSIVDVTDPLNPVECVFITDNYSHPDIKTYKHFAYVVFDNSSNSTKGLAIIDLSGLPDTATVAGYYNTTFQTAHNLWIDTLQGFAYIARADGTFATGVRILDLADPVNPVEVGSWDQDNLIFHDVITYNDTLLGSIITTKSKIIVLDVSNKSNPVFIDSIDFGGNAHNTWYSEGHMFISTTNELDFGKVLTWDIRDIHNMTIVHEFQIDNSGVGPHNVAIRDEFAYIAYWTAGLVILDITCPDEPILIGQYDTSPLVFSSANRFKGARMAYPFLPSGNILVSDTDEGLFVISFDDPSPPLDLNIENQTFTGTDVFRAKRNMIISNVTIEPGSDITFVSGHSIIFTPFFHAKLGCKMHAYIDPYCTGSLILQRIQNPSKGQVNDSDLEDKLFTDLSDQLINIDLRCYPNPFSSITNIEFSLKKSGKIKLYIKNIYGQIVARLDDGQLHKKGTYLITYDSYDLPPGIYYYTLHIGELKKIQKMVKIK